MNRVPTFRRIIDKDVYDDLSLSRRLHWKKMLWKLTAEVNNVFNQQYEVVQWYPMPGINFRFVINVEL